MEEERKQGTKEEGTNEVGIKARKKRRIVRRKVAKEVGR